MLEEFVPMRVDGGYPGTYAHWLMSEGGRLGEMQQKSAIATPWD
jgi:hypothetical protein